MIFPEIITRIRRLKSSLIAAKAAYRTLSTPKSQKDRLNLSLLMSVHMLEKAMAADNTKYLSSVKYSALIDSTTRLLNMGLPPDDYTIAGSVSVIRSALATLPGHDGEKSQHNIPKFSGAETKYTVSPSRYITQRTDGRKEQSSLSG